MSLVASTSSGSRDAQEWSVVLRAPDGRLVLYNSAQRNFSLASVSADVPVFQQDPLIEEEPEDQQQGVSLQVVPRRSARRSSELSLPAPAVSSSSSTAAAATSPSASHAAAGGDRVCPLCGSDLLGTGGRRRARDHSPRSATDTRNSRNSSGSAGNDEVESTQFMFRNHKQRHRAHAKPSLPPTENSYFALLSDSRMGTPTQSGRDGPEPQPDDPRLNEATMNTGYYDTFFRTIEKLGQGSNGSVYLVQHVLNGEPLGLYACKKVAVGNSTPALLSILREVHLLETLQNPHVISYHHAWIELVPATAFAPAVPTLFILMSYANGGSLEDFVRSRKPESSDPAEEGLSKAERIRYMRMKRMGAVHLFRVDEILSIFQDVTEGLAFLHSRNILHLDLKAANVLLHWEEDALLPTAKLCDFGSSDASFAAWSRARTGISGTLEYSAPESWNRDPKTGKLLPATRARDVWALGLILHLLCYFSLPWKNDRDIPQLEQEIKSYSGFLASEALTSENCLRHDLPMDLLTLMADMVHRDPLHRPKCDTILERIEHIRDRLVEQGQLPVQPGGASLVRQTSPSSFAPVPATTTSDLFHASSFQPQYGVSAARPSLQLVRRTSPPSAVSRPWLRSLLHAQVHVQHNGSWTIRIGRVQLVVPRRTRHQMVITLMGVSRLVLLEWHCSGGGQGHRQTKLSWTCAMLVLAVLEVVLNDYRLSISTLLASAAVALASTQGRGMCRAQPLSNQL